MGPSSTAWLSFAARVPARAMPPAKVAPTTQSLEKNGPCFSPECRSHGIHGETTVTGENAMSHHGTSLAVIGAAALLAFAPEVSQAQAKPKPTSSKRIP